MSTYRGELLKLIPHAIVIALLLACWQARLPPAVAAIAGAVAGAIFHTVADVTVEPERGGPRLRWTIGSNLVFSALVCLGVVLGLYSV